MTTNHAEAPEIARALIENGFQVVPLPCRQKGPKIKNWNILSFSTDDFSHDNGIGIKTGQGVVALDLDVYDPAVVESIVAEFELRFGPTLRRTGCAPKTALLVQTVVPKKMVVKLRATGCAPVNDKGNVKSEQVEVLTDGQQLVAFGIHPDTGEPYHWHGKEPWAKGDRTEDVLPSVTHAELEAFLRWIEATYGNPAFSVAAPKAMLSGNLAVLAGYIEPDVVAEGGRNDQVLKYVGHLRGKGTPESVMLNAALNFNKAKCHPPLDDDEVAKIVAVYASQGHPDASEWEEPMPLEKGLAPAPTFNFDMLPRVFVDFVRDSSERMGVPADYIAVPLMLSAAAALGSGWVVCPKAMDKGWKETPVLWGGIVARPGSKKSPCLQLTAKPLHRIEAKLKTAYSQAKAQYQMAKRAAKDNPAALMTLVEPKQERAVVQDATYQSLAELCSASPHGLMAQWDEVAAMISAWRTKGQEAARGFFLISWGGDQPYTLDRKEGGMTFIMRLSIVISGGVQPSVLGSLVRDARQNGAANDGLLQRFQLLVYPDDNHAPEEVDRKADELAENRAMAAVERLRAITPKEVGVEEEKPTGRGILNFSEEAQPIFNTIRAAIDKQTKNPTCDPLLAAHYSKMSGAISKLAMLLHLLDDGKGDITVAAATKAVLWANYMRGHAKRVYSLSQVADEDGASRLLEAIKAGALTDGFTGPDIRRKGWTGLKSDENVAAALDMLVKAGWLRQQQQQPAGPQGGRPTTKYIINPKARSQ
jgi:hypothetical protein